MTAATALAIGLDDFAPALQRQANNQFSRDIADRLHSVCSQSSAPSAASLHPKISDGENGMSYRPNGRKDREQLPIDELDDRGLAKKVAAALAVDFGNLKAANKEVAKISDASIKSAENWTAGHNPPSLLYFLRLYAKSPALQAEVRRLTAMEAELNPDLQRDLHRFVQLMAAR